MMWLFMGIIAIIAALCNLAQAARGKNPEIFRYISVSATALVVCDFLQNIKRWVGFRDYGAIEDVVPYTTTALWILVIASILINGLTLFASKGDSN